MQKYIRQYFVDNAERLRAYQFEKQLRRALEPFAHDAVMREVREMQFRLHSWKMKNPGKFLMRPQAGR